MSQSGFLNSPFGEEQIYTGCASRLHCTGWAERSLDLTMHGTANPAHISIDVVPLFVNKCT
eukprot:6478157-Amphidinium_carterae.1